MKTLLALFLSLFVASAQLADFAIPEWVTMLNPSLAAETECNTIQNIRTNYDTTGTQFGRQASDLFIAQRFYASNNYDACKVSVYLSPYGTPVQDVYASIHNIADATNMPGTIRGVESSSVSLAGLGTNAIITFTLSGTNLIATSNYFLLLRASAFDGANYPIWIRFNPGSTLTNSITISSDGVEGNWANASDSRISRYIIYSQ